MALLVGVCFFIACYGEATGLGNRGSDTMNATSNNLFIWPKLTIYPRVSHRRSQAHPHLSTKTAHAYTSDKSSDFRAQQSTSPNTPPQNCPQTFTLTARYSSSRSPNRYRNSQQPYMAQPHPLTSSLQNTPPVSAPAPLPHATANPSLQPSNFFANRGHS
jgi:hypothetical protein